MPDEYLLSSPSSSCPLILGPLGSIFSSWKSFSPLLPGGHSSCIGLYHAQSGPELYKTSSDFSFNDALFDPPVPHHLSSICSLYLISFFFFSILMTGHLHGYLFLCSIHSQQAGSWFCSHPSNPK